MNVSIEQGSAEDKEYTAFYSPIVYSISYQLDGGQMTDDNPISYDITLATITLNNPTKEGYSFTGWTGTDSVAASMTLSIPQGSMGDRTYIANWIEFEMRPIPAGTFTMGSPTDELGRYSYETQHQVTISEDFWMGTFEVTQDQYFAIMNTNPSNFKEGAAANVRPTTSANYPVESVSYNAITAANTGFLAQINAQLAEHLPSGYRFDLPTEAQWEYACRAGTTTSLNSGKNITVPIGSGNCPNLNEVAWYASNSSSKTHNVGGLASNTWGLYDMHGNVYEWCKDWVDSNYYTTCGDCSDPVGPDTGSHRVGRGGSCYNYPRYCRSAVRLNGAPSGSNNYLGFRAALVPTH